MASDPAVDPAVAAVLDGVAPLQLARLMELRALILATAAQTEGVGAITETLKWNEPAYLPKTPRTGTTVRMNAVRGSDTAYALYVPCQTDLIEMFRTHYRDVLRFEGKRAILLDAHKPMPKGALAHCIALAFTYHLRPAHGSDRSD